MPFIGSLFAEVVTDAAEKAIQKYIDVKTPERLTVTKAAKFLGVHPKTIHRWAAKQKILIHHKYDPTNDRKSVYLLKSEINHLKKQ